MNETAYIFNLDEDPFEMVNLWERAPFQKVKTTLIARICDYWEVSSGSESGSGSGPGPGSGSPHPSPLTPHPCTLQNSMVDTVWVADVSGSKKKSVHSTYVDNPSITLYNPL